MLLRSSRHVFHSFQSPKSHSVLPYCARARHARMASQIAKLPIFEAIKGHDPHSVAVVHSESGRSFTYGELLRDVAASKTRLLQVAGREDIAGERIAFLIENGYDYVVTFLSALANNAIALPMSASYPTPELRYILNLSQASVFLSSKKLQEKANEVIEDGLDKVPQLFQVEKILEGDRTSEEIELVSGSDARAGMMLFTSGTTSRPKGALLPSATLTAQCRSILHAWKYSPSDRLLHCLPLHHVHGIMNALLTPLFAGSTVEFTFPFNPKTVWERFASPFLPADQQKQKEKITFFTVVPTVYSRLFDSFPKDLSAEVQEAAKKGISPDNLRVNISGSAALPTPTKAKWTELSSGNVLLERYGMTEVGMALSCGLAYEDRVDGSVGWPLPGVEVRLVDSDTNEIIPLGEEVDKDGKERSGEIQLRGPTIFKEYWRNPEATASEFVEGEDGQGKWFKTGDVAIRKVVDTAGKSDQEWAKGPMYFIQGRKSADIIKTGGEKVSALEIEREMLSLPQVAECAVVPLDSEKWGQKVAAVVVLTEEGKTAGKDGKQWSPLDMRRAMKERIVAYKIPQEMKVIETLPKNAMGKVNKKNLIKEVFGEQ